MSSSDDNKPLTVAAARQIINESCENLVKDCITQWAAEAKEGPKRKTPVVVIQSVQSDHIGDCSTVVVPRSEVTDEEAKFLARITGTCPSEEDVMDDDEEKLLDAICKRGKEMDAMTAFGDPDLCIVVMCQLYY